MQTALWTAKTGLTAMDRQLSVISNNLANVSTTGFKKERAVFENLMYQTLKSPGGLSAQNTELPSGLQIGAGVRVTGMQKNFEEGDYNVTDRNLDVAIQGAGFFQITRSDGTTAYTRDGSFQLNSEGQMVDSSGNLLDPQISFDSDVVDITIGDDGTVSVLRAGETDQEEIGSITIANFINPAGLYFLGGNLYEETSASGAPIVGVPGEEGLGELGQGMLEASNVNSVEELVNMITTQRAYEMNSKVISTADGMLGFVTQQL
ncbi:flagellar basal-body rod protein FlgG [Marinomonas mediterranea]|jgi:flagellar basal-body rod protein FlgG, Gram-negative bacteria|uniref:Flagellar basal-body rod protein FlgG n=1 Tax=Marinomonas mediterranea (strain ATCC 700492 / JCM 21426 / NBRC 103028 / MMB-1) TaxID=717774 RepID=F2K4T6_MARM1|nr:flagellar basal-body rod protein FlgG [Marinomonas mediterranea]ADZ92579.1 flagellar basal-body rod protein FlgG [Marinomonas mediterranea MMB-1]WCN10522.1 flagellar basal-body rod protein FlgG [Marinomonas mediterranea]WCN14572.1 flagellar basal-body rod protein FlgG [Marinomonas mediterranea]WCN18621.1 flagellar basal-body rod protein FlgG [Marinomonas mediterranea MMB-1]